jgi:hypothetical protein
MAHRIVHQGSNGCGAIFISGSLAEGLYERKVVKHGGFSPINPLGNEAL